MGAKLKMNMTFPKHLTRCLEREIETFGGAVVAVSTGRKGHLVVVGSSMEPEENDLSATGKGPAFLKIASLKSCSVIR